MAATAQNVPIDDQVITGRTPIACFQKHIARSASGNSKRPGCARIHGHRTVFRYKLNRTNCRRRQIFEGQNGSICIGGRSRRLIDDLRRLDIYGRRGHDVHCDRLAGSDFTQINSGGCPCSDSIHLEV